MSDEGVRKKNLGRVVFHKVKYTRLALIVQLNDFNEFGYFFEREFIRESICDAARLVNTTALEIESLPRPNDVV